MKRDPHHKSLLCLGISHGFLQMDLRAPLSEPVLAQSRAHSDLLMDLDYNPNKLNTVATCGQDSALRFWDLRRSDKCLLQFEEDSHFLTKVKYNRFHD